MRWEIWKFNRFLPEKPYQTGTLAKMPLMLIDVAVLAPTCGHPHLQHHPFFKRALSTLVSKNAVASAALAA
jgi:hypothetical protein